MTDEDALKCCEIGARQWELQILLFNEHRRIESHKLKDKFHNWASKFKALFENLKRLGHDINGDRG